MVVRDEVVPYFLDLRSRIIMFVSLLHLNEKLNCVVNDVNICLFDVLTWIT